jgi:hypothetical protein
VNDITYVIEPRSRNVPGFFVGKGGNKMKWPKLLNEMYRACLEHNTIKEKELFIKALKKNIKARNKNKPRTVPQVTVRG